MLSSNLSILCPLVSHLHIHSCLLDTRINQAMSDIPSTYRPIDPTLLLQDEESGFIPLKYAPLHIEEPSDLALSDGYESSSSLESLAPEELAFDDDDWLKPSVEPPVLAPAVDCTFYTNARTAINQPPIRQPLGQLSNSQLALGHLAFSMPAEHSSPTEAPQELPQPPILTEAIPELPQPEMSTEPTQELPQTDNPTRETIQDTSSDAPPPGPIRKKFGRPKGTLNNSCSGSETGGFSPAQTRYIILLRSYEGFAWHEIPGRVMDEFNITGLAREALTMPNVRRRYASAIQEPGTESVRISDGEKQMRKAYRRFHAALQRARSEGNEPHGLGSEVKAEVKGWMQRLRA